MKTLLLLGATGLVGQQVLKLAIYHADISRILAPTRCALESHPKLENPIVNFDRLPEDAPWWKADAVICALGTTLKQAKSKDAFYQVDHDYVLSAARLARRAGTKTFVLNSALGSNPEA